MNTVDGAPHGAARSAPLFPRAEDLRAWADWQRRRQPWPRRLRDALQPSRRRAPARRLVHRGAEIHTLVAVESFGPAQTAALLAPLQVASPQQLQGVAYLVPDGPRPQLPGGTGQVADEPLDAGSQPPQVLGGLRQVLAVGDYLASGALARRWALALEAEFFVAQHGLLAYQVPPLPQDAHLLAFSAEDADWWRAGRADVEVTVTGSQLLTDAAHRSAALSDPADPGLFLGQLHGAELSRGEMARAAELYCCATAARYRPHPAETDRLSRLTHRRWAARGISVESPADTRGTAPAPLAETTGPVASVFSTGVLEAAAAGRRAWVVHPDPPAWLEEFWQRYRMSRWTPHGATTPTPAPPLPEISPARRIAEILFGGGGA